MKKDKNLARETILHASEEAPLLLLTGVDGSVILFS
jgi:hypothetical protein